MHSKSQRSCSPACQQAEQHFLDAAGSGGLELLLDSGLQGCVADFDGHGSLLGLTVREMAACAGASRLIGIRCACSRIFATSKASSMRRRWSMSVPNPLATRRAVSARMTPLACRQPKG